MLLRMPPLEIARTPDRPFKKWQVPDAFRLLPVLRLSGYISDERKQKQKQQDIMPHRFRQMSVQEAGVACHLPPPSASSVCSVSPLSPSLLLKLNVSSWELPVDTN